MNYRSRKTTMVFKRLCLLLASAWVFTLPFKGVALAVSQDLVISEIMYDPPGSDTGKEWIEVKNTGNQTIQVIGGSSAGAWRIATKSRSAASFTNSTFDGTQPIGSIGAGQYAILTNNPSFFITQYPNFAGTIIKISSSSFSIPNDGFVGLRVGSSGIIWSLIDLPTKIGENNHSFEFDQDGITWRESYVDGGTPGSGPSTPPPPPVYSSNVFVNEVYPNPNTGQDEFIELYNSDSQSIIDLSGWQIDDIDSGGSNPYTIPAGTQISPGGYLVFYGKFALNNNGDFARLIAPDQNEKSAMQYFSSTKGRSWARKNDGSFALTRIITPSTLNQFFTPVQSRDIVINEIMPDPATGSNDEFIELHNIGQMAIDITDWQIDDIAGGGSLPYVFPENTIVPAGGYWIIYNPTSGVGLNNDGDHIRLMWADETQVEDIVYSDSKKGDSYSRHTDNTFSWTSVPSPGSPNQFQTPTEISSQAQATPPSQSPIEIVKVGQSARSVALATDQDMSSEFRLPPSPLLLPKILGQEFTPTLASSSKDSTIPKNATVGSSGIVFLLGGVHQWFIKRKTNKK